MYVYVCMLCERMCVYKNEIYQKKLLILFAIEIKIKYYI